MNKRWLFLPLLPCAIACGTTADDGAVGSVYNYTNDAGVSIPPYGNEGPATKVRFAIDDGPVVEAADATIDVMRNTYLFKRRRFTLKARSDTDTGNPSLTVEFGEGTRAVRTGDYRCDQSTAGVVLVDADGNTLASEVNEEVTRGCIVHVDEVVRQQPHPFYITVDRITGWFEATIGAPNDEKAPTRKIRGAFALSIREPKNL